MKNINENTADKTKAAGFGFITLLFRFFNHPLNTLQAAPLVIMASSRLAYALAAAVCLLFVFFVSFFLMFITEKTHGNLALKNDVKLLPKKSRALIFILFANFAGAIFYFCFYLFNPLLSLEILFIILFTPVLAYFYEIIKKKNCYGKDGVLASNGEYGFNMVKDRVFDALKLGFLIIVFSLIREPLGYATLSLPFGSEGITELFNKNGAFPYTIEIVSLSSGAFLILGFIISLFRALDRRKMERL